MKNYKLLTPGPPTTTKTVKEEMLFDWCTWDDEYKAITQKIRFELLGIAKASPEVYTTVLIQGSGSFGVESVLNSTISEKDKLLIISNGAYGVRIMKMAKYMGINYVCHNLQYDKVFEIDDIKDILDKDIEITHLAMVHSETTTGILNPLGEIARISKDYCKILIIDAMSSFGGIPIDVQNLEIDYLVSSSNKCIQGVPGFCFVIAKIESLLKCCGNSKSLCLDLYDQWESMDKDGKWRFTSPTHVVAAFSKAIDELIAEGGVESRNNRYKKNSYLLRTKLKEIGFDAYIKEELQSPIITTFLFPCENFDFSNFYNYVKERGYVLYPGKLAEVNYFRIGNIGEIYEEDIEKICTIIESYMRGKKHE
ncbi:2-aminoethylphosphonate--pyruvate transaminase [Clostridium estertheticum]|uniref:2-aminoethylphosphonate--pyruvate transaminase n=1 Tax=Clostridium estertheticum TaxID=238834 RepID=UPI001C7CC882|nr:2-aminoethylphosphonate--pyruvate transaminase [Clostridium estertheticum]MBX4266889.1 2-aminoethylphosphonate--pyruvate transaminase [Clostridium estertheticum]WLC89771.1 2-aminoethylphosphonate--pyruvate transaminase [Clostridium estertheticum]